MLTSKDTTATKHVNILLLLPLLKRGRGLDNSEPLLNYKPLYVLHWAEMLFCSKRRTGT